MPDEDYLERLNENLGRLTSILDEYDETEGSLDSLEAAAGNIEDIFDEAVSEINDLGGRLDMRIAQSRKKDEIIDEMADRIDELESAETEDLDPEYLLGEIESLLDEYISDTGTSAKPAYISNYKSPTFNFGVGASPQPFGNFKSPTFNFDSMPESRHRNYRSSGRSGNTNILSGWADYNWEGWEDIGEPEFDTPAEYAESRGVSQSDSSYGSDWPSIRIRYHEEDDFDGWIDSPERAGGKTSLGSEFLWGGAAS